MTRNIGEDKVSLYQMIIYDDINRLIDSSEMDKSEPQSLKVSELSLEIVKMIILK